MCGLLGYVDFKGLSDDQLGPRTTKAMDRITPRGPDSSGEWRDDFCWLGHRRLSIIDLTEGGHQPMVRGDLVISYNGEIYNFQALRLELETLGQQFQSRSDTEVLLAGWQCWGPALFDKLHGMFALAIWDKAKKTLTLARDRFGKKPLLYRVHQGHLAFGSDLVALGHLSPDDLKLDRQALRLFFQLRFIPSPWSIIEDIKKLPAGHMAIFDETGFDISPWYQPGPARINQGLSLDDAAAQFLDIFDRAVSDRLVADVPVGAFLSGGIDSAGVVASLHAQGKSVSTFTIGFPGAADYYEERPAARALANHLGIDHIEVAVDPSDARDVIGDVFAASDEPFADSSALPQYLLCRETKKQFSVALSGDGADEVFGGYRKYQGELWAESYQAIPAFLRHGLIEPLAKTLPEGKQNKILETIRRGKRFISAGGLGAAQRQAGWMALMDESRLNALLGDSNTGDENLVSLITRLQASARSDDPINRVLETDTKLGLEGDMLVKVDRMSMAHGLEVRSPFLDHRLVEFAQSLGGDLKLRKGQGKVILRHAFAGRLPAEVFTRPKKGFEMPIAEWLKSDLTDMVRTAIDPVALRNQGLINPDIPKNWYDDLCASRQDTSWHLWALLGLQSWLGGHGKAIGVSLS